MRHVAIAVNHHQQRHRGHNHQHQTTQAVHHQPHLQVKRSRHRPGEIPRIGVMPQNLTPEQRHRQGQGHPHQQQNQHRIPPPQATSPFPEGNQPGAHQGCPQ